MSKSVGSGGVDFEETQVSFGFVVQPSSFEFRDIQYSKG